MSVAHVHYWILDKDGVGVCACDPARLRAFENTVKMPANMPRSFGTIRAIPSHMHRPRRADWGAEDRDE